MKSYLRTTTAAILLSSPAAAQFIGNWDILFSSLATDFQQSVTNEITMDYQIGKGRVFEVDLYQKDCTGSIASTTITPTTNRTTLIGDTEHEGLVIMIDLDKPTITSSNIWVDGSLQFCVVLQLLSGGEVIKEDKREIDIAFDLSVDFELANVVMQSASMSSGSGTAHVGKYIKACKCNGPGFVCNNNKLSPNSFMNICISSIDGDVEINYVDSFQLFQDNTLEDQTMNVILSNIVQNLEISSLTVVNSTAVIITTVVPSRFFTYGGESALDVRGTVEMALVGSRRLAAEASNETVFEIKVDLESEGGLAEHGDPRPTSVSAASTMEYSFIGLSILFALML
jgi:hypothetical protein